MNFILSVKNQEAKLFDYSLTKTAIVIQRLQDFEFEQKEIYNFDLLDQLLSQDSSADKLSIMINQLADESETSWLFIDEFVDRTTYLNKFIKLLAAHWKRMWFYIASNVTLTYDRQIQYLVALVKVLNPEELSCQNENACLVEFIERHYDILRRLEAAGCDNLQDVIKELRLSFHCLELDDVSDDLQSFIFNGHYYELNWSMVRSIVAFIEKDSLNKLEEQPYSTVISLQYQPLIEDVHENIDRYTREIILTRESIHDQNEDILALLERLITIPDLCISLVKREQFCLPHLYDCCMNLTKEYEETVEEIWTVMLSEKKVDTTWENVVTFWKNWSLENALKDYIADNINELIISLVDTVPDEFIADFIRSSFSEDVKRKALSVLRMDDFSLEINELDKVTLKILIEYHYFDFSVSRFSAIYNADVSLSIDYIMGNQREFMDDFAEIEMTSDLFERVLLDNRLDDDIRRNLFETNVEKYMTAKIAAQMNQMEMGRHITKAIFDAGWNCLNSDGKEALLYKNLCVLDAEDFERCFTDLGDKYKDFLGRDSSHEVTLFNSEDHEQLAVRLKEVGYITSYRKKEEIIYDTILGADKTVDQIKYRIKQVKKEENPNG